MAELIHLYVVESHRARREARFEESNHLILESDDMKARLWEGLFERESQASSP
jgi:hypothetical protein